MIDDILGLGCDILEVGRLEGLLRKGRDVFIKRVLTPGEIDEYERRSDKSAIRGTLFVATRYCAKEAFSKAMGTGVGAQFSFQDLSVLNSDSGAPVLVYSERLENWLQSRRAQAKISISDEQNYVMSTVILYSKQ
ncbi:MAG: holo-[acyl-carrier-protein] synthase [Limnobacter sp.]|jgi:holo-[acyl-carrier protein] synthase|uniref:Holo-[acyl-carrier-protein] synthase n=1 Tax=Limnobacter profundi TaxID=2732163 RepID=A0ABX6N865_9BURK|nr:MULTISPECIES: holo-ACP synthase [unclassified Limnobacter]MAG80338.1 holo-[acyl-carrier-protein] synthase [Sutterellaceae bacterium]MBA4314633.1 holo-[acyl-carrier-protein] synthase [Alcaligenaceae bacterium]MBT85506.1 holo-[acyl-carrier-protein] synthase [Sutterellaceae bacterium]MDP3270685.1 holo-ACP synthase [Limnobacter sp.]MDZ4049622.1 holo-ACP synthase [Limnobacter sp.]|tara:strand:+ start:2294 stop:2698 length:405 start_codon:yes stop_codon:yes gene_type:complete